MWLRQTAGEAESIDFAKTMREASSLLNASTPSNVHLKTEPHHGSVIEVNRIHPAQILTKNMLAAFLPLLNGFIGM